MDVGKFRDVHFSEPELRELRYAALLHDFGKIGVRENVLTKAKKLFPDEVEKIQHRADFIRRTIHWETAQAKVDLLKQGPNQNIEAVLKRIEEREAGDLANIDRFFSTILKANEPSRLDAATLDILKSIGSRTFRDVKGELEAFLKPDELSRLMIPQGTLSDAERDEINSHVSHTFKFLSKIPWTQDLRNVAYIAFSHHEKLDGTGYPRKLSGAAIPLPAQIMSICDIYDALAASDRPYKKAIPTEKALDILAMEVKGGKIDAELFQIFLDGKAYETFQK